MSWLGLTDHIDGRFSVSGLAKRRGGPSSGETLDRGTIMFETEIAGHTRPHEIFGISHQFPNARSLTFSAIPGGGIALVHRHHNDMVHAAICWGDDGRALTLRVSFAWDADLGWARLALEQPETAKALTTSVHAPRAQFTHDVRDLILGYGDRKLSKEVLFGAVSAGIVPIGPMPTLHPATPIATPSGFCEAGKLKRGDLIVAETGDSVPVLHTVRHSMPARGCFAPVRLHAPYFGLKRDIVVSPDQRLVLHGSDVEYIFGQQAVLVPARHVVNGQTASWAASGAIVDYVQVVLPGHEVLVAAGCSLESLYIGRLRRNKTQLEQSVLADIPARLLPEHGQPIHQILRSFEAITLVDYRAA